MILQALNELYDRLKDDDSYGIPPTGYSRQGIGFKVVLTTEGELWGVADLRSVDAKRTQRQLFVPGGSKPSGATSPASVKKKVHLLRNDLPYLLGLDGKFAQGPLEFDAFRDHHLSIEEAVGDEQFSVVCSFLRSWNPEKARTHPRCSNWIEFTKCQGIFQIVGEESFVHERSAVRVWWDGRTVESASGHDAPSGQCLISGKVSRLARIHEPKIKRVHGASSSGAGLVTFNEAAYESYGKEQSYNAPISQSAATRYSTALNALTSGPMSRKHGIHLGDTSLLFWTERPTATEDVFARFASSGDDTHSDEAQDQGLVQKLEAFVKALRRGREAYGDFENSPENTCFYLLGLAPNRSRLSVRFFHRASVADLLDQLRRHQAHIAVKPQPARGNRRPDPEFPSLRALLDQACPLKKGKPDREKIPPVLTGPLLRAVITGTRYPDALYGAVLRRIRVGDAINYLRACLISGHLRRNLNLEIPVSLDTTRDDPGYRMGRLFAALEKTQADYHMRDGGKRPNATIRDRFYGSASATPGSVFPRLLRTYQHHLAKLEGGHKVNREKLVQEILGGIADIPSHLNLAAQGLFALGYYHQLQNFYTKKQSDPTPPTPQEES